MTMGKLERSQSQTPSIVNGINNSLHFSAKFQESVPLKCQTHLYSEKEFHTKFEDLRKQAVIIATTSVFCNFSLAVAAFVWALLRNSASTSAFAAGCALDVFSSAIVFWRYYGSTHNQFMHEREHIACIYLGSMFIISASAIVGKAVMDLITKTLPSTIDLMLYLSTIAVIVCSILALTKLVLYRKMRSDSILLDAINTFLSALFAVVIIVTLLIIDSNPQMWYLDPMMSILLATSMALYGIRVIWVNFSTPSEKEGYLSIP